ncbi:MAG: hypothetical protein ACR2JC_19670 [Chloroflexota bacterium]|nr:MAG: hypothetical protein DLM70_01790 [Chloroflexota bacterium]
MILAIVDVLLLIIAAAFALLTVSLLVTGALSWRRRPANIDPGAFEPATDDLGRKKRHESIEAQGEQLIERRVELDLRRGTLGGYTDINDAFTLLEERLRAGDISDEKFEKEKIRLLMRGTE